MPAVFFDLDPAESLATVPDVPGWHSLHGSPDLAAVRLLRAADVCPGDRWVGTLDSVRHFDHRAPLERLRGYWRYDLTADPVPVDGDRIQLCVCDGEPYVVTRDDWMLVIPARPAGEALCLRAAHRRRGRPVPLDRILYRVRSVWPRARWVLREPAGGVPTLTWRGGPTVDEVAEELRWPMLDMTRTD